MNRFEKIINTILAANIVLSEQTLPPDNDDDLLQAIGQVESGNNDDAVGDNGKALGRYQIWYVYWKDAVEYDPSIGGEYSDVTDPDYAKKIVLAYWARYATKGRLGHEPTDEDKARIHNGGPNGHKKDSTLKYWDKVQDVIVDIPPPDEEGEDELDSYDYSSFVPDPNVLYLEPFRFIPGSWK
jgi:hypothetical protein